MSDETMGGLIKEIFVFGSNLAGIHGAGAALFARERKGAVRGKGEGLMGESYGLPTCDHHIRPMTLEDIKPHITKCLEFAKGHPELTFRVTRIGCGLAGLTNEEVAPLFQSAPPNCNFDPQWAPWFPREVIRDRP